MRLRTKKNRYRLVSFILALIFLTSSFTDHLLGLRVFADDPISIENFTF